MNTALNAFLLGAVAQASLVAALFFLWYWRKTGDRFFLLFALAFFADAIGRAALLFFSPVPQPQEPLFYISRVVMFGLIVAAILDKNLRGRSGRSQRNS